MKDRDKAVVVLGMHRSGTSMTAGILKEIGVSMGRRLFPPKESNPMGHFEDLDFLALNLSILEAAGGDEVNVPSAEAIRAQGMSFADRIAGLIGARGRGVWGWKDPRTALTMELFFPYLENPYFIVCRRDAHAVAASLRKRNGYDLEVGQKLKEEYDGRIEGFFRDHPGLKRLDLEYDAALADPEAFVQEIVDFLEMRVDEKRRRAAVALISSKEELRGMRDRIRHRDAIRHWPRELGRKIRAAAYRKR